VTLEQVRDPVSNSSPPPHLDQHSIYPQSYIRPPTQAHLSSPVLVKFIFVVPNDCAAFRTTLESFGTTPQGNHERFLVVRNDQAECPCDSFLLGPLATYIRRHLTNKADRDHPKLFGKRRLPLKPTPLPVPGLRYSCYWSAFCSARSDFFDP
jgi:hypothetical protein